MVYFFLIFFIVLLSIFGLLLFIVLPFWPTRRRIIFQRVFQLASRAYLWTTFQNRVYQENPNNIDLSQPAIFISNHQSLIDTPLVLMQHPKLNILTNNWVIYSPIFGPIAHLAGFFNVSKGLEVVRDQLREKMKAGYSLVVFPEGTRSRTGKMGRFHKGAFYLAEELGLPIQPMLLHGDGDFLRKGEFYGRDNTIHVKLLERIPHDDTSFGTTYREKAKQFRRYMSREYRQMREQYEKPPYWAFNVIRNYIYKGPVLEWYVRVKLRLENYFRQLYELLPKQGRIVDLGCGYGYMDYMLAYGPNEREIIGIDYDGEKVEVANHCYAKDERLSFRCADVLNDNLPASDAFVLFDLLHYLPYEEQKTLLQSCIERLNEGGTIVIRDGDRHLKDRHQGTRFTEFLSTRFGFNQTHDDRKQLYFLAHEDIENIISPYPVTLERVAEGKRTSNVMWVVRKSDEGRVTGVEGRGTSNG
jgi:1-acyl-sn-glycerol-3-phosphate acyltransferase